MGVFYFDMDGVLVYFNEEHSKTRPFLVPGNHYYRNLPPDELAVELFRHLQSLPNTNVLVCTRLYYGESPDAKLPELLQEQERDKLEWCKEHLGVTQDEFFCLPAAKSKDPIIEAVPIDLRGDSILIDDDTRMLYGWCAAGGDGAQFIQGHRTTCQDPEWRGPVLGRGDLRACLRELRKYRLLKE